MGAFSGAPASGEILLCFMCVNALHLRVVEAGGQSQGARGSRSPPLLGQGPAAAPAQGAGPFCEASVPACLSQPPPVALSSKTGWPGQEPQEGRPSAACPNSLGGKTKPRPRPTTTGSGGWRLFPAWLVTVALGAGAASSLRPVLPASAFHPARVPQGLEFPPQRVSLLLNPSGAA